MRFDINAVEYGGAEKQLLYLVKQLSQSGILPHSVPPQVTGDRA